MLYATRTLYLTNGKGILRTYTAAIQIVNLMIRFMTVKSHKLVLENNMLDPLYISNPHINSNITLDEVAAAILKAKKLSACGIDKIPFDVLKFPRS